jgi:hypothetical protein
VNNERPSSGDHFVLLAQFIDYTIKVGRQRRGFETKVLLQPLTRRSAAAKKVAGL